MEERGGRERGMMDGGMERGIDGWKRKAKRGRERDRE